MSEMGTTAMVVELIVVGSGSALSLAVLFIWLEDPDLQQIGAAMDPAVILAVLPFVYVLGVVVDRAANGLLSGYATSLRPVEFKSRADFQAARRRYANDPVAWSLAEYGRMRARICRGWFLNSLVIGLLLLSIRLGDAQHVMADFRLTSFFFTLGACCFFAWRSLIRTELTAMAGMAAAPTDITE